MNPLVEMREVSYTYRTRVEDVRALHRFSFELNAGESVALMGPSGSGKSTVLLLLGLMRTIHEGEILVDGSAAPSDARSRARWRNRHVGFVFQEYAIIEDLCVWENVALPLEYGETRVSRRERRRRAIDELGRYGIADVADRRARDLSGGQRQRVSIARATINSPQIILADEPTAALDAAASENVIGVLEGLRTEGRGIVIATHDHRIAERCDRVVQMR